MPFTGDDVIRIEGLVELQRSLRTIDAGLARHLRVANKAAAEVVAERAKQRFDSAATTRTGRAKASIRAAGEQRGASVKGGNARAPYFGFLDYGNKRDTGGGVGRGDSHPRPFIKGGRIIYPALGERTDQVLEKYDEEIDALLREANLR